MVVDLRELIASPGTGTAHQPGANAVLLPSAATRDGARPHPKRPYGQLAPVAALQLSGELSVIVVFVAVTMPRALNKPPPAVAA